MFCYLSCFIPLQFLAKLLYIIINIIRGKGVLKSLLCVHNVYINISVQIKIPKYLDSDVTLNI